MEAALSADPSPIFTFFNRLPRKAPGSEASTRRALGMLPVRPMRMVEFGCGSGIATVPLATATGAVITAVDLHPPFLKAMQSDAAAAGVAPSIHPVAADMASPPFADGVFDVVWSEAAIYSVGFERGLRAWRPLLKSGGFLVVSEATWLSNTPPDEVRKFWAEGYPAMTTIEGNLATMRAVGFEPIGHFTVPEEDWWNYYRPMEEELQRFDAEAPGDAQVAAFVEGERREIALWRRSEGSYGYVFYLARA